MKISVVTAVFNSQNTIGDAIDSVQSQTYSSVEHLIIDGMSTDETPNIVAAKMSEKTIYIREPDNGIYDALNKGIDASTGDVVGFLHADDIMHDEQCLGRVQEKFCSGEFDAVYADLLYVDYQDTENVIRYWKSGPYSRRRYYWGWMPPHPTVYVLRETYQKLGNYLTDFGSGADYECLIRLMVRGGIRVGYIPHILTRMRVGGQSNASIMNRLAANKSDRDSWIVNGLVPPLGLRISKPLFKLKQYFHRPAETGQPITR